jgi:methylenetetrahydrofolate reductase (NADPH)
MVSLLGRRRGLDEASSAALRTALEDPIFEVLPLQNLPELHEDGFRAIPHLSARMIPERAKLAELLDRARAAGLTHAFVVGGDADEPGEYLDGLSLLQAMTELGHPFEVIGCPAYPNGHADIPDAALEQALRDKAPYVQHVTSQMDFDTTLITRWVHGLRAEGFTTDIVIGVPGVADPQKLLNVAARIGVKDAKRFLVKNLRFVTGMARSGGFYKPTGFVEALAPLLADDAAGVTGFHLYTFNAVEATEAWRHSMLDGTR